MTSTVIVLAIGSCFPRRCDKTTPRSHPTTVILRSFADQLDRDIRQVHDDVQLLAEYRIVHLQDAGRVKQPFVPYEIVRIEVEISVSTAEDAESITSAE